MNTLTPNLPYHTAKSTARPSKFGLDSYLCLHLSNITPPPSPSPFDTCDDDTTGPIFLKVEPHSCPFQNVSAFSSTIAILTYLFLLLFSTLSTLSLFLLSFSFPPPSSLSQQPPTFDLPPLLQVQIHSFVNNSIVKGEEHSLR